MTVVVYTRLADELKQALAARARERGLSLNATACQLIEQGLQAGEDERAGERLERELAAAASELQAARARLAEAELRLQAASEREQLLASAYAAFAERARRQLASCPHCHKPLRGVDLLGSLVVNEYVALLGALGVLAGLALTSSADHAH